MANSDGFIKMAVGALVVAIVAIGVILPLFANAEATEATFTNEGYFRMAHIDAADETVHTFEWEYTNPSTITIDGEEFNPNYTVSNSSITIVVDTNWILRYYTDGNGAGRAFGLLTATSAGTISGNTGQQTNVSLTLSAGSLTGTIGAATISETYTDAYIPDDAGTFVMKNTSSNVYINGDSEIVAYGITAVNTASSTYSAGLSFVGNYGDGVTATVWRGADNIALSAVTINATENSNYLNLYSLKSITATAAYTETVGEETVTTNTDVTYTYFLVPYQVTAELADHPDGVELTIIQILPVLVLVGVLMMIVTAFISNRRA